MEKPSSRNTVEVEIMGQQLLLRADIEPQDVQELAAYVQQKLDEIKKRGPVAASRLMIVAALNIANDYFRTRDELNALKRQVADRSRALLRELEE